MPAPRKYQDPPRAGHRAGAPHRDHSLAPELRESGVAVERRTEERPQDERVRWNASRAQSSASGRVCR
jgi:hypothetical protein